MKSGKTQFTDRESIAEILREAYFGKLDDQGVEYLIWENMGEFPNTFMESTIKDEFDVSLDEMAKYFDYRDFDHYLETQTATLQPCKQGLPLS